MEHRVRRGKSFAVIAVLLMSVSLFAIVSVSDTGDADSSFIVQDGTGRSFAYSGPANRIVSGGAGATMTIADAGAIDKIVAVDKYSLYSYNSYPQLETLTTNSLGSFYGTTNHDYIRTTLVGMVDSGDLSLDDTIILTSYSSNETLRTILESEGFTKVLVWVSIDSYQGIVDFVRTVSLIATGGTPASVADMDAKIAHVQDYISSYSERPKAMYVAYYSGSLMIGNKGIMPSMLEIVGADIIGKDPDKGKNYGDTNTIVTLLENNRDTVLFVQNSYFTGHTLDEFYTEVFGGDRSVLVVPMGLHWNNWNPESADGLTEIAVNLYDRPSAPAGNDDGNKYVAYASAALVILVAAMIVWGIYCLVQIRRTGNGSIGIRNFAKMSAVLAAVSVILFLFILLDLSWAGNRTLGIIDTWNALMGHGTWGNDIIVNKQNLPRVAFGIFVGAGLAVTGAVMQAVFRNPLATPYILGLSSGASLGSAIAISIFTASLAIFQPILAFVFCLLTMVIVYAISHTRGNSVRTETLVLAGVAVSSLISALVSLLTYIAPSDRMGSIVFWTMGNLGNVVSSGWTDFLIAVPFIVAGIILMFTQCRNLNALMLGDAHAMDLGVDVRKVRLFLLVISTLVVAACVAFVGTIGFIGLVIPHIMRLILGPDNRIIIPTSAVAGAAFIIMCDYLAHLTAPIYGVLPIGVVTALIGAPFFIYLLAKKRREVGW